MCVGNSNLTFAFPRAGFLNICPSLYSTLCTTLLFLELLCMCYFASPFRSTTGITGDDVIASYFWTGRSNAIQQRFRACGRAFWACEKHMLELYSLSWASYWSVLCSLVGLAARLPGSGCCVYHQEQLQVPQCLRNAVLGKHLHEGWRNSACMGLGYLPVPLAFTSPSHVLNPPSKCIVVKFNISGILQVELGCLGRKLQQGSGKNWTYIC